MKRPNTIMIEGRAYRWRAILELRRKQLEQWHAAPPQQPVLIDLKEDRRPAAERYREPKRGAKSVILKGRLRELNPGFAKMRTSFVLESRSNGLPTHPSQ